MQVLKYSAPSRVIRDKFFKRMQEISRCELKLGEEGKEDTEDEIIETIGNRISCVPTQNGLVSLTGVYMLKIENP